MHVHNILEAVERSFLWEGNTCGLVWSHKNGENNREVVGQSMAWRELSKACRSQMHIFMCTEGSLYRMVVVKFKNVINVDLTKFLFLVYTRDILLSR